MLFPTVILQWFSEHGRLLPWRQTRDPYAIWLSEIILQQTRIDQGLPYWQRFMERWPRVDLLAAATEDEVLKMWQGLGYYSRARNLHTAAMQVVQAHDNAGGDAGKAVFPNTYDGIRALKGVGDYTAAAIASFAFDLPYAVVDGNVYRVLSRYFGIDTPINTTQGKKLFAALAQEQLPRDRACDYNQAMMDFGALQCVPQSPHCESCPLMESCEAFRQGRVGQLPVKLKTLKIKERRFSYYYIRCRGQVAIHQRGAGDIWQGLWELPDLTEPNLKTALAETLAATEPRLIAHDVKHVLTHRVIYADLYMVEVAERPTLPHGYIWVNEKALAHYAWPRLLDILLEKCATHR